MTDDKKPKKQDRPQETEDSSQPIPTESSTTEIPPSSKSDNSQDSPIPSEKPKLKTPTKSGQPETPDTEKSTSAPPDSPSETKPEKTRPKKEKEPTPQTPDKGTRKKEGKPPKSKEKEAAKDDFKYIVRIANTDINGEHNIVLGLSQIKGIGRRLACIIADYAHLNRSFKMGNLTDQQIEKIRDILTQIDEIAPAWMLNHRKDLDTGKNIHHIGAEINLRLRDDINLLKMIRSYRGIRHESNLPVRGQRTRSNSRTGLTLGVSKKKT